MNMLKQINKLFYILNIFKLTCKIMFFGIGTLCLKISQCKHYEIIKEFYETGYAQLVLIVCYKVVNFETKRLEVLFLNSLA